MKKFLAAAILSVATLAAATSAQAGSLYFFDTPSGTNIISPSAGYVGSTFSTPGGGFNLITPGSGYVGSFTPNSSGGVFRSIWD